MRSILLFLIMMTGLSFFFLAPLNRYINSKRANEVASRAREIEKNLHICEDMLNESEPRKQEKMDKRQSDRRYHSSVNADFLECLHSAVYNTPAETAAAKSNRSQ